MQLSDYEPFPNTIPIIVEDNTFLYPFMINPMFLSIKEDIKSANYAMEHNSLVFVTSTAIGKESIRGYDALFTFGVIGSIMRKVNLPDGRVKILFQGLKRGRISNPPTGEYPLALIHTVENRPYDKRKIKAIMDLLREKMQILSSLNSSYPNDLLRTLNDDRDPYRVADLVSSMLKLDKNIAYKLYTEEDLEKRFIGIIDIILSQIEAGKLQKEIRNKVNNNIEHNNKEYFLKEQLKQIQHDLGGDTQREEEIKLFRENLDSIKPFLKDDAYNEIKKQLDRFARIHPDSGDSNTLQTYLEWVFEMPFGKVSNKSLSIKDVAQELDKDHYSLEKPKDRIVEFFSVRELAELRGLGSNKDRGVILCFVGPPGVGKTSLANSIATALKRPLIRIALGGLEDVNELRGHRRTYVGAMPGRVVQGLIEAKSMNPVVVLDEIDKVGRSNRGDPTSVLLEILDPEQNDNYRDYYLNFHLDLSKAIFIATANDVGRIPAPLRDRMEFIGLSSYTPHEKFEIANRYLIPQELKKHALKRREFSITPTALKRLIEEYTRESGVRNLRRKLASLMRKSAKRLLEDSKIEKVSINLKNLNEFAEKRVFEISPVESEPNIGVVNGLAWTSVGGDVLTIEAVKIKGKGTLQLTGSLGDVMKESARIAYSVVKILIDEKRIEILQDIIPKSPKELEESTEVDSSEIYKRYDLHIHVPEGATPKDGPSAGVAMVTVIASILSNSKIDNRVAMTGEVTLTGKVLPIGGLKEKLIAGYKAGVTKALIPYKNYERDLDDIPDEVKDNLTIIPIRRVEEILKEVLVED